MRAAGTAAQTIARRALPVILTPDLLRRLALRQKEGIIMTTRECYDAMGGNYDEVIRRLGNEERVRRFLRKLSQDGSFPSLCQGMEDQDWETAFRAAHSLKGISMNLELTALAASSGALTEALRPPFSGVDPAPLFQQVREDYSRMLSAIDGLEGA